ncbi:hypothetical protein KQ945_14395 [Bacillus subtilis subsp. subtilis]|nr:hypothetical protein [Bacillus subtilis subsp. subtilis]
MKRLPTFALSPLLAMTLIATSVPAAAQNFAHASPVTSSVVATSVVSLAVITAPVWLSALGVSELHDASMPHNRAARAAKRKKAGPLPPLTVERVAQQPDGGYRVDLRNPQAPDDLAVVEWPARADNPAAGVKVGDVLDFKPTPAGAGWTVAAADGTALAFLPTGAAAATSMSERF